MSKTMIPYPFMNLVEKSNEGQRRYGEIQNDGLRDWKQRAELLREQLRGMGIGEQEEKMKDFIRSMEAARSRGKLTQAECDDISECLDYI